MFNSSKAWFRYLPVTPRMQRWGVYVQDAGFTLIPPGTDYPPGKHPEDHSLTWENGRILDSFTLVYITRGQGEFESASGGARSIREGDIFILFPQEWHRYRPDITTGWDEYWVEFSGEQAHRVMHHPGFNRKHPVIPIGHDDDLLRLFIEITENIDAAIAGFEHIIAAKTSLIAALLLAAIQNNSSANADAPAMIHKACCRIFEQSEQTIDFGQMARELGIGLSGFRKRFKQVTGLPPGQYQIQIRINKARELLLKTSLPIGEISARLGFDSVYYFSRIFKAKTGLSPRACRQQSGGCNTTGRPADPL